MRYPISAITNGIHTRSWVSDDMQGLFNRYLGPHWIVELTNQAVWTQISNIPDPELWRIHERRRERLITFARQRQEQKQTLSGTLGRRSQAYLTKSNRTQETDSAAIKALNSAALTIGFARRFATYKRATLLFQDVNRLDKILNHPERPVQLIFAGKAHPHDYEGKLLIQRIARIAAEPRFYHKIVFIEDYDICVGRYLVEGVDVWLNNPLRPNEASGYERYESRSKRRTQPEYRRWVVGRSKPLRRWMDNQYGNRLQTMQNPTTRCTLTPFTNSLRKRLCPSSMSVVSLMMSLISGSHA